MSLNSLSFPLEDNSRPVPMAPINNFNCRLPAPDGQTPLTLPLGARMVRVSSFSADVFVLGGKVAATTKVSAPAASVLDGSAPDLVPAGGREFFFLAGNTFLAVQSAGDVYVEVYK